MLFIGIKKSKRKNKRFVFEYINKENQLKKIHFGQYGGLTYIDHVAVPPIIYIDFLYDFFGTILLYKLVVNYIEILY